MFRPLVAILRGTAIKGNYLTLVADIKILFLITESVTVKMSLK
jgi:hypothetical protein